MIRAVKTEQPGDIPAKDPGGIGPTRGHTGAWLA